MFLHGQQQSAWVTTRNQDSLRCVWLWSHLMMNVRDRYEQGLIEPRCSWNGPVWMLRSNDLGNALVIAFRGWRGRVLCMAMPGSGLRS